MTSRVGGRGPGETFQPAAGGSAGRMPCSCPAPHILSPQVNPDRPSALQPGGDAPGSPTDPLGGGGRHRPAPGLTRRLPRRSGVQGLLGDVEATPWALRAGTPKPGPVPGPGCAAPRWWARQAADQLGDVGSPPRSGSQLPTGHQSLALGNTGACARPAVP